MSLVLPLLELQIPCSLEPVTRDVDYIVNVRVSYQYVIRKSSNKYTVYSLPYTGGVV